MVSCTERDSFSPVESSSSVFVQISGERDEPGAQPDSADGRQAIVDLRHPQKNIVKYLNPKKCHCSIYLAKAALCFSCLYYHLVNVINLTQITQVPRLPNHSLCFVHLLLIILVLSIFLCPKVIILSGLHCITARTDLKLSN